MKTLYSFLVLCLSLKATAQTNSVAATLLSPFRSDADESKKRPFKKKLFQKSFHKIYEGVILMRNKTNIVELIGDSDDWNEERESIWTSIKFNNI